MAKAPYRANVFAPISYCPILCYLEGERGAEIIERFWSKVARADLSECWDWTASANEKRYGRFKIASHEARHANRVAWAIHNRREPGELLIRHTCDRPICCNPHHLLIGTPTDNMRDMVERGRHARRDQRGELNRAARLTAAQVGEIIGLFRRHYPNDRIAARYPVGHSLISRIRTGRSWQREAASHGWQPAVDYLDTQSRNAPALARLSPQTVEAVS